jgi:biopolymer transport protein TolQ
MNQSISILLKSYLDSDLFGKGIFIALFLLSILTWIVIGYKAHLYRNVQKTIKQKTEKIYRSQEGVLNLNLPSVQTAIDPLQELYSRMKDKTIKILEKNQYFCAKKDTAIFLTKDDLSLIALDLEAGIAKEMKKIESGLYILNSSVSLAPFLGILGTVWGILISLFEMQKGSSSFSNTIIIQGLSTALATTVIGLLIAIPALIGHAYLKAIAKSIALDLGLFSSDLISKLELQYKKVE